MKDATEILMVLDKSGSMELLVMDVIGGFNSFLKKQQALQGEAFLTVVLFDTSWHVLHKRTPIKDAGFLNKKRYRPSGCTSLIDSLMYAIVIEGNALAKLPEEERPNKVMIVVMTDGEENSSFKFSMEELRQKIKHQQEVYSWEFLYFGANVDVFSEARKLGINERLAMGYASSGRGVQDAYEKIHDMVSDARLK